MHVTTYIEQLSQARSAPSAKLRLAALRPLFDWMAIGQMMPTNPAAAVRGPRHIVQRGKTPVLDPAQARQLIDATVIHKSRRTVGDLFAPRLRPLRLVGRHPAHDFFLGQGAAIGPFNFI